MIDGITLAFLDKCIEKLYDLDIEVIEASWLYQKDLKKTAPDLLGIIIKDNLSNQTSKVWIDKPSILDWAYTVCFKAAETKLNKIIANISFDLEVLSDTIPPEEVTFYIGTLDDYNDRGQFILEDFPYSHWGEEDCTGYSW